MNVRMGKLTMIVSLMSNELFYISFWAINLVCALTVFISVYFGID